MSEVTLILQAIKQGDPLASDRLLPVLYDELRRLAAGMMGHERPGHTLQATALVHEAYLRLIGGQGTEGWESRRHFFGAAAEAMRRILVEAARRRAAIKRGGDAQRVFPMDMAVTCAVSDEDLLGLDEALEGLASEEPAAAELVRLRFFAGLGLEDAAALLGVSPATAKRTWRYARAWLQDAMGGGSADA